MQAQFDQIKQKVQDCIRTAEQKFGITMPNVEVRFDLTGRAAGMACMRYGQFSLRFNLQHIRIGGKTWEHLLNDTVPHEVAHTVCQAFPKFGRNHDAGWKRVCIALGGTGRRCYSEEDAPEAVAQARPYVYITTTGHEVRVTKVIHSKIQRGTNYIMRGGKGKLNKECQYNYMAAPKPAVVVQPAPSAAETVPTLKLGAATRTVELKRPAAAKASNAELVRARIAQAKARAESELTVVQWAVEVLGMKPALARTYVKNNWSKA